MLVGRQGAKCAPCACVHGRIRVSGPVFGPWGGSDQPTIRNQNVLPILFNINVVGQRRDCYGSFGHLCTLPHMAESGRFY